MNVDDVLETRTVLTDTGRGALGLPPVAPVRLIPLLDLPWRPDRKDRRDHP